MSKPKPRRIASIGCTVVIDGQECRPHEGEWVEMISAESVGELRMRVKVGRISVELDAVRGEPDEGRRVNELYDAHYQELLSFLAERVFAWSWTDLKGRALPEPTDTEGNPLGLLRLRAGELYWLLNATGAETPAERKND